MVKLFIPSRITEGIGQTRPLICPDRRKLLEQWGFKITQDLPLFDTLHVPEGWDVQVTNDITRLADREVNATRRVHFKYRDRIYDLIVEHDPAKQAA